jgi:hypothetical protein
MCGILVPWISFGRSNATLLLYSTLLYSTLLLLSQAGESSSFNFILIHIPEGETKMRVSYQLLIQFAQSGDIQALLTLTELRKLDNLESPTMQAEIHFQQKPGFFLFSPNGSDTFLPKRAVTITGIPAPHSSLGSAPLITDDDDE